MRRVHCDGGSLGGLDLSVYPAVVGALVPLSQSKGSDVGSFQIFVSAIDTRRAAR
ncbi:MAG: hypothetical protein Q7T44_14025 [Parvibaculum sp.]|nr:hypothetical protein [Parvibaculum sp.]